MKKVVQPKTQWVPRGTIVDGTHYLVSGDLAQNSGIVLCVNGIGSHWIFFDKLRACLGDIGYCVIQYDLLGRGHSSPHISGKYGELEHIEQLHNLITSVLSIQNRIHLVAHSMGGSLATLYTARYPDSVQSLTLMCPAGLMNPGPVPYLRNWSFLSSIGRWISEPVSTQEAGWRRDFFNHTGVYKAREDEMVEHMRYNFDNPSAFDAIWQCVLQFPLYGIDEKVVAVSQLEHLHVFLMWGENDIPVPYEPCFSRWSDILGKGKGKFTSKLLKQAGHAFMLEHPEETNESVIQFLKSVR